MFAQNAQGAVFDAAEAFIRAMVENAPDGLKHKIAVQVFGRTAEIRIVQAFTDDLDVLLAKLEMMRATQESLGSTNLYGAYQQALQAVLAEGRDLELVERSVVLFTDGKHEASAQEPIRTETLDAKRAAEETGHLTAFSVYLGGEDDAEAIGAIRELASAGEGDFRLASADRIDELTDAFEGFARKLRGIAQSNYVVGVCTPVELDVGRLTVQVTAGGVAAPPLSVSYPTDQLTADLDACDAADLATPCRNRQCGPGAIAGVQCGACAEVGPEGSVCEASECVCRPGFELCEGRCVDVRVNTQHCGACGNVCAIGADCTNAACRCPVGEGICDGRCIDITTVENCGMCGNQCPVDASCSDQQCVCPRGFELCEGWCVDEGLGLGDPCTSGLGACERRGARRCTADGAVECNATPGDPIDEVCNNVDDDCDGRTDEGLGLGVGDPCTSGGVGACVREGIRRCTADGAVECDAAPGDASDEVCNDVDDDCDGLVDEHEEVDAMCCSAGVDAPPCNGCPAGTRVPDGWVCIPPGTFTMGSPAGEAERRPNERPQHQVTISEPFLMMTTEVTQAQWTAVFDNSPSENRGRGEPCAQCPVENVNWWEAIAYANALSRAANLPECYQPQECQGAVGVDLDCDAAADVQFVGLACEGYRLPTEAEWEYAARAGTETRFWSGDAEADLARVGWYHANSSPNNRQNTRQTHPVGGLPANPWGLFDVHGNVLEWVYDWHDAYDAADQEDPLGPQGGTSRVVRGGGYIFPARSARSASRYDGVPWLRLHDFGFRLVLRPSL